MSQRRAVLEMLQEPTTASASAQTWSLQTLSRPIVALSSKSRLLVFSLAPDAQFQCRA